MAKRSQLTQAEIARAFEQGASHDRFPPVLNTEQVLELLQVPRSTFDLWKAEGRFDGTFRKRGKRVRFWRDRVLDKYFNSPDW